MNKLHFCQSCSMPIDDPEMRGTELGGSKNPDYCRYCYQNGSFVNPAMTLQEMTELVKNKMEEMKIEKNIIDMAMHSLPTLKRWNLVTT